MYAVIRSGGKQYRVTPGQTIRLEKLAGEKGATVQLDKVLLVEDAGKLQSGTELSSARVEATIVDSDRAKKILVFHKKRKKQYRKTRGHRQDYTAVRIEKILL